MRFLLKISSVNVTKIRRKLWIWSHLPKKSIMENFILSVVLDCAVLDVMYDFQEIVRLTIKVDTHFHVTVEIGIVLT